MKKAKKIMYLFLGIIALLVIGGVGYLNLPKFGKNPSGERLARIEKSPNYKNGAFQNLSETPQFTGDKNIVVALWEFLFKEHPNKIPRKQIPSIKTDLKAFKTDENVLVWLGHSAYFMQLDGKKFLIDPTLVTASPVDWFNKPFQGSELYTPEDIPAVDYLVITHDHWDHLDYETMKALKPKIGRVITSLGVGSHFEYWGFPQENITELDWNEHFQTENVKVTALPARHFSGRSLVRNKTLWSSFMLESASKTIYIGGDSGYDTFYKEIGKQFPNIDLAILENGQYNADWRNIHIMPDELPQAIKDLNPKRVLPVHNSKYALAYHTWSEPLEEIYKHSQTENFRLLTPKIGEVVALDNEQQQFEKWWE